jgi:dTDP-4-dehydrorhamnose reductase
MKILILGRGGWLGGRFYDFLKEKNIEVATNPFDINSINILDPDVGAVVNFAASADIDWCEKNKNIAFWNNVLGAANIARTCKGHGVKHIFLSSACILRSKDENDVKYEDDIPSPISFYGETKMIAEKLIQEIDPTSLILRLRIPISEIPHPRNMLNKFVNYNKLINSQESFSVVEDILPKLLDLIQLDTSGIYHLANEGTISPAEVGKLIGHDFETIDKKELDKRLIEEGRAARTSTIVGSRRGYLPPIRERVVEVVNKWKENI